MFSINIHRLNNPMDNVDDDDDDYIPHLTANLHATHCIDLHQAKKGNRMKTPVKQDDASPSRWPDCCHSPDPGYQDGPYVSVEDRYGENIKEKNSTNRTNRGMQQRARHPVQKVPSLFVLGLLVGETLAGTVTMPKSRVSYPFILISSMPKRKTTRSQNERR